MANTSTGITSTPTSPKKNKFTWPKLDWKTLQNRLGSYVGKILKYLGRIGAGAIVLFALAHFVPELREEMPSFYRLVDWIIDAIEWVYTQFWAIYT